MLHKIYLSSPHMGGGEQKYVKEAFQTNWIAPLGPNVEGFERDLENYLGNNKKVASLSSGTAAIHLALILLGVGEGDEVLCQSMTFSASANPIVYQKATPIFIDSEPETWNICPSHLESAIKDRIAKGKKPKAIIAVHLYGMPCKLDEILQLGKEYEIPVIEDSAEALGSTYKGRNCGSFGEFSILSFNGNKIITTSGGGALVCNNQKQKEKAVFLATQARDDAPHYQHSQIGYNYRLSNVCAGIGRGQMEVLEKHVAKRRENHRTYSQFFKDAPHIQVFSESSEEYKSNHWLTCITIDKEASFSTEEVRTSLQQANIEARPLWKPMHLQPVFKEAPYYGESVSENLFKKGLCLPSGSSLEESDMQRIKDVLSNFI